MGFKIKPKVTAESEKNEKKHGNLIRYQYINIIYVKSATK